MDENDQKILELISIIIRLNNKINLNEYNKEITQHDNYVDCIKNPTKISNYPKEKTLPKKSYRV
ncbi:MAG: hypothetical protein ACL7AX_03665 [Candidatus Arsenophonus phytopathogenicus]